MYGVHLSNSNNAACYLKTKVVFNILQHVISFSAYTDHGGHILQYKPQRSNSVLESKQRID